MLSHQSGFRYHFRDIWQKSDIMASSRKSFVAENPFPDFFRREAICTIFQQDASLAFPAFLIQRSTCTKYTTLYIHAILKLSIFHAHTPEGSGNIFISRRIIRLLISSLDHHFYIEITPETSSILWWWKYAFIEFFEFSDRDVIKPFFIRG